MTLIFVKPTMLLDVAWMLVVPTLRPVASPVESIVATSCTVEAHVTCDVISCVVPSVYLPVALNCCVTPPEDKLTVGFVGVIEIDCSGAVCTVSVAVPLTVPELAVMVTAPAAIPFTNPVVLMVAEVFGDDDHTIDESDFTLPSL